MGPLSTQILGDFGADVITIEPPEGGGNRGMGAGPHPELSGIALNLLRNKRSVCLDLKKAEGRRAALEIARTCDAMVTNLRPSPLRRLGLSYDDVISVRPDIVFCQVHGFPSESPRADDPAYDDIIQTESGLADLSRRAGRAPELAPTILADKICGMAIVNAVLAGLLHREKSREGQRLEIAMIDVMSAFMLVEHGAGGIARPPAGPVGWERVLSSERGPQQTADGWIHVLPYTAEAFDALFVTGGRVELVNPNRTKREIAANATLLYGELRKVIRTQTTSYWLDFCRTRHIPVGEMTTLDEMVERLPTLVHPVVGSYKSIPSPIRFSKTPAAVSRPAPCLGQDGGAILLEVGYSAPEVERLTRDGVLGRATA
jgi:crotonobetainyl-CoA:carnitine CoA-transferase CaiB-like acyl-CoA transferase